MIKWMRPSGKEIETGEGEGIEAYAKEHGWVRSSMSFEELKPKRTRRTKLQMEAARRELGNRRANTESEPEQDTSPIL